VFFRLFSDACGFFGIYNRDMKRTDPRYRAALDHLLDRINYEKSTDRPYNQNNFKLDRMAYFLDLLGNPQLQAPVVHIAGTKGKGSVSWLLAESFRRNGMKTGLYTSPHLLDIEERFVVDSQPIEPKELVEILQQIRPAEEACTQSPHGRPTFFEMTTAIGWLAFSNHKTDVNVIEVGLGGRLDSTNVCSPAICIITSISYDHQQQLGNTLAQIAGEKAGIIKSSIPVICGAREPEAFEVIQRKATQESSQLRQLGRDFHSQWKPIPEALSAILEYTDSRNSAGPFSLRMLGKHQADNAAIAVATWDKLKELGWQLSDHALAGSLANTQVPARLEVLSKSPCWILDTAHNEASIEALIETLATYFPVHPKSVIFACSKDKKASQMLDRLTQFADRIILTQYHSNPRFTPVEKLLSIAQQSDPTRRCEIRKANDIQAAMALSQEPLVSGRQAQTAVHIITGSFFIASEAKLHFALGGQPDPK
jgi:dihydrofolate synthase/folylpolyglutamate synthase